MKNIAEWPIIEITVLSFGALALALVAYAVIRRGSSSLALISAGLFAALLTTAAGISTAWVETLDVSVAHRFAPPNSHRSFVLADSAFRFIGQPEGVAIVAAVCGAAISVWRRSVMPVLLVLGGVAVSVTVEHTFKSLLGRTVDLAELPSHSALLLDYIHSFPSGHVAGSFALVGMIAVLLGSGHGRAVRAALAVGVAVCVSAVAWMALYVHAHLFSDVIGGTFLGGAIVSLGAAVYGAVAAQSR